MREDSSTPYSLRLDFGGGRGQDYYWWRWCVQDVGAESPGHGDCACVELTHCEGLYQWHEVQLGHREVASEDLKEAIVEIGLNEYNEGRCHILLDRRLGS